jgi:hypothetical protein
VVAALRQLRHGGDQILDEQHNAVGSRLDLLEPRRGSFGPTRRSEAEGRHTISMHPDDAEEDEL